MSSWVWVSPRMETPQLSGQPAVFNHPHSKMFNRTSCVSYPFLVKFMPISSCPDESVCLFALLGLSISLCWIPWGSHFSASPEVMKYLWMVAEPFVHQPLLCNTCKPAEGSACPTTPVTNEDVKQFCFTVSPWRTALMGSPQLDFMLLTRIPRAQEFIHFSVHLTAHLSHPCLVSLSMRTLSR